MNQNIFPVKSKDYPILIEIWEKSVQATHDFLPNHHIKQLKSIIYNTYFGTLSMMCVKDLKGHILGFSGVSERKLEMLFITPKAQGHGFGSKLCQHVIKHQNVTHVDVNEQNPKARLFYEKMGFKVFSRSSLDGQGNPYPILHMNYDTKAPLNNLLI